MGKTHLGMIDLGQSPPNISIPHSVFNPISSVFPTGLTSYSMILYDNYICNFRPVGVSDFWASVLYMQIYSQTQICRCISNTRPCHRRIECLLRFSVSYIVFLSWFYTLSPATKKYKQNKKLNDSVCHCLGKRGNVHLWLHCRSLTDTECSVNTMKC